MKKQTTGNERTDGIINKTLVTSIFILAVIFTFGANATAATITWDGGGADNNWSTAANWGTDAVPTGADNVVFDATSAKNAVIDAAFTVNSVSINSGYSGTVTQTAVLTVNNAFSQSAGTFQGTAADAIFGVLVLNAGSTFNAPSGTLSLTSQSAYYIFDFNGGVFNSNGGTFNANGRPDTNYFRGLTPTFNNLIFSKPVAIIGSPLVVNGDLTLASGADLQSNYIQANGNVSFADGANTVTGGSTEIRFSDTATRTATISGTTISLPILINNPNITVTTSAMSGTVVWNKKVTIQAGELQQTAANYLFNVFAGFNNPGFNVTGGTFQGGAGNAIFNTSIGISSGNLNGGSGDLGTSVANCPSFPQPNYYFQQSGGSFNGGTGSAKLCDVRTTGGTFTAPAGNLTILNYADLTGIAFNHNGGTLKIADNATVGAANLIFNNVTLEGANGHGLVGTPKPRINGTFNLAEGAFSNGDVAVNGAVVYGASFTGGGGRLFFEDSATRTVNLPARNILLGMTIDNPNIAVTTSGAGASTFVNFVEVKRGLLQQGNAILNFGANELKVSGGTFQGSAFDLNVSGIAVSGGTFQGGAGLVNAAGTINTSGGTFASGGDVNLSTYTQSGGTFNAPNGLMTVVADWTHTAGGTFNGGTGTVKFTGYQTFNCQNTIGIDVATTETFNNLTIANSFCNRRVIDNADTLIVGGDFRIAYGFIQNGRIRPLGTTTVDATNNGYVGSSIVEYFAPNRNFVVNNPSSTVNMLPVEINAANSTLTNSGSGRINFSSFNLINGTVNQGAGIWDMSTIYPGYSQSGGTFNGSAAEVFISQGTGNPLLTGGVFNSGAGKVTGSFRITGGTMSIAGDFDTVGFSLEGGTFNAPLGTMTVAQTFSHTAGGTFNARTGTVQSGTSAGVYQIAFYTNGETFNNLKFNGTNNNANHVIVGGNTLIVNGTLTFNGRGLNGGSIVANGDVVYTNFGGYQNATTLVKFQDAAARTVTFSNDCTSYFQPTLVDNPNITINTGCDTAGAVLTWTSLDLRQGTINAGNARSGFVGNFTQSGGIFNGGSNATSPAINIGGDFTQSGGIFNAAPSTAFAGNFTHTAGGTFNYGAGTVIFGGSGGTIDVNANESFNNLAFQTAGSPKTIAAGDALIANGDLNFQAGGVNGGTIDAKANVSVLNQFAGGTTNLNFSGAANQTFTNTGGTTTGGAWTINKSNTTPLAGNDFAPAVVSTLITTGNIGSVPSGIYPAFNVVSGNVQKGAGDFALGSLTLAAGTYLYSLSNGTFTLAGDVQNDGRLTLDANGAGCQADGIFLRSSAAGVRRAWSGSGQFRLIDVDVRDQAGTAPITAFNSTNSGNNGANWTFDDSCIAPTAATVTIGGRVLDANGRGIRQARVTLTDGSGEIRYAATNPFGYYRFTDVSAGQTVIVAVSHKTASFADAIRVFTVTEAAPNVDFVGNYK